MLMAWNLSSNAIHVHLYRIRSQTVHQVRSHAEREEAGVSVE